MSVEMMLLAIAVVGGFYMAWSIGANDVANAMGTSVGSGALTIKRAVIVAGVLEFAGAFLVGTHVSETIRKGIINPDIFVGQPLVLVYGMIGALLSAAVWLQIASYFGWPVSTTHSIVGAVLGFGVMIGGVEAADWAKVASVVSSWVVSPLLSGSIAFAIFTLLRRLIYYSDDPIQAAKRITPFIVFLVFLVLTLTMVFKGLKNLSLNLNFFEALLTASIVGVIASFFSVFLVRRIHPAQIEERVYMKQPVSVGKGLAKAIKKLEKVSDEARGEVSGQLKTLVNDLHAVEAGVKRGMTEERGSAEYKTVQRVFVYLQILSAAFVAFAHGANDVANAVGPLAAVITVLKTSTVLMQTAVPLWVLGLGGLGIVIGLATWGWRVMMTIGKKITELTPTRGFSAEFAAATTIVVASKLGLPISTTHTLVGGVLGVGLARGIGALNLRVILDIVISWVITIPVGALGAIIFYYLLSGLFG
ncbi:inorganic phosphate transporter [Candidatus Saccharibacteria bacterium]|nr:inorganic phosphate transporter [Calditrichia bacterium]NIV72415.1 inorganic phosphate transporter [Calditrichia bacterium]NIW00124.1 inorganic phosphate transporter [Candidatus Saccharibacteria bacterium]NIW79780.1 inorganic phosphate transporter [Calditrichia bacterium]